MGIDIAAIIADGIVDLEEVQEIRADMYEDGVIDREEADQLFEINDGVSGNENAPEWKAFMIEAITDHVLADDVSPGVLDDEEATWLRAQIEGDGAVDDVEKGILENIIKTAKSVPDDFAAWVGTL